jgi:segregation and condensation protein B
MQDIKDIIESLLFVADEPVSLDKLKGLLETAESADIKAALQALAESYESRGGGFSLYEVAGGWQLRSRPEYNPWIKRMLQPSPQRLSKPALETLAIVAYNQPIIRADIEHIRGVDCGAVLRQLMERKLIRVLGRKEIPGRPLIYATTKLFLEIFGLKDLRDLPSPKEIEEMASALEETGPGGAQKAQNDEPLGKSESFDDLWNNDDAPEAPGTASQPRDAVERVGARPISALAGALQGSSPLSVLHLEPRPILGSPPPRTNRPPADIPAAHSLNRIGWRPHATYSRKSR